MEVRVRPVASRADQEAFLRFPWAIYANDPLWVPPLLEEERKRFDRIKHPFFEHGQAEWFLAFQGDQLCGRVCASIDARFEKAWGRKAVWFGAFECSDDPEVARQLLDAVSSWGRARGAREVLGPAYFSMNDLCGLAIDGPQTLPPLLLPHNPRYYGALIEGARFEKHVDLLTFRTDSAPADAKVRLAERARERGGFTTRGFNPRRFEQDIRLIQSLYNESWRDNWGAVPMTDREMLELAKEIRPFADFELIRFAFAGDRAVALCLSAPDINPLLKKLDGRMGPIGILRFLWGRRRMKGVRTILFGVIPEYRGRGLDILLATESIQLGLKRGYTSVELGWTLESNQLINAFLSELASPSRRLRIYRRPISI